jgi:hypothetical protein
MLCFRASVISLRGRRSCRIVFVKFELQSQLGEKWWRLNAPRGCDDYAQNCIGHRGLGDLKDDGSGVRDYTGPCFY